jgi:5-methylthioadenosine/S-adenosylhomocysteine deaminase
MSILAEHLWFRLGWRKRRGSREDDMRQRHRRKRLIPCPCCDDAALPAAVDAPSRRRFLQAGAALAAGAAVSPAPVFAQSGPTDPELSRVQAARRILIKGGVVLTMDRQVGDFAQGDILIEDSKIREIRPNIAASGDGLAVIEAANHVVIPGFIDTHSHSYQGLLRGMLASGLLNPDYNRDVQNVLTPVYEATDAYAGELLTALGMIDAGTTAIVDISQVNHTPGHSDALIQALKDSGIRAVYSYHRGSGPGSKYPQDVKRLQQAYFSSKDQLLTLAMTGSLTADIHRLAREIDVPVVQHLVGSNLTVKLQELAAAGLLKPGDEYIHCLGIDDAGWRLIKDTGGNVSLCTAIDMSMGHGTPTIQEALDHGFRPSLSSDHGVTITQDMFNLMRQTFTFQRLQVLQRGRKSEQNLPPLLTCRDLLEFATLAGARCANLADKVGSLTPGKEADIVMMRADRLDVWPLNNAAGAVVNLMSPRHVETVFIAGKARKWRGSLVDIDMARVLQIVQEARDGVIRRANYQVNLLG